jgi:restriction endonuclease S subunit
VKEGAEISSEYLFAYLKSRIGASALLAGAYGSVIQHINEEFVGAIEVPLLNRDEIKIITAKIKDYVVKFDFAIKAENQAISLVEKEIASCQ